MSATSRAQTSPCRQRGEPKGEFQAAAAGKLAPGENEQVSIQCYNGPANAEHWMRFSDFRILKLND
jgi:hypothetical protein